MRVFGTKQVEPTNEDRVAAARLSAVAARFKVDSQAEFTEATPDPLGEPEPTDDAVAPIEASEEPEEPGSEE